MHLLLRGETVDQPVVNLDPFNFTDTHCGQGPLPECSCREVPRHHTEFPNTRAGLKQTGKSCLAISRAAKRRKKVALRQRKVGTFSRGGPSVYQEEPCDAFLRFDKASPPTCVRPVAVKEAVVKIDIAILAQFMKVADSMSRS